MKKIISFAVALLAVCACNFITVDGKSLDELLSSKGKTRFIASKTIIEKTYDVDRFDRIDCAGSFDIDYTAGQHYLSISAPDNVMEYIIVEVKDDCLEVKMDKTLKVINLQKIQLTVHSPKLNGVSISGAGDFKAEDGIRADDLNVKISGAGDFEANGIKAGNLSIRISGAGDVDADNIDCKEVSAWISGAGDIELSGKTKTADIRISGAGDIDIRDLKADNTDTRISGAGKVYR